MNATYAFERAAVGPAPLPLPICTFRPEASGLERFMGPLEAAIMESVWAARGIPVSVKATWKNIRTEYRESIAYTTVMTTMGRLRDKGFLERVKKSFAYHYTPRETRAQFEARQIAAILDSLEIER